METQPHEDTNDKDDGVVLDRANKLLREMKSGHEWIVITWRILLVCFRSGQLKDERMTEFVKCVMSLFGEILIVDKKAAIAPITISNDLAEDMITDKTNIPSNYTKLSKWVMLSVGSST
jgi:hypothetical protein